MQTAPKKQRTVAEDCAEILEASHYPGHGKISSLGVSSSCFVLLLQRVPSSR